MEFGGNRRLGQSASDHRAATIYLTNEFAISTQLSWMNKGRLHTVSTG